MDEINVERSPTKIIQSNFPAMYLGRSKQRFDCKLAITPPVTNDLIYVVADISFEVINDVQSTYTFSTQTSFGVKSTLAEDSTCSFIYDLILMAVAEFNAELSKIRSTLTHGEQYKPPSFEELYPKIKAMLHVNRMN